MHSSRIPKSPSTAVSSTLSTSVTASGVSQPEPASGRRLENTFVGRKTTVHTPESKQIPTDGLRLLAEVSTSQIDPFAALATHQTTTFDDDDQRQSASSLSLSNESPQPVGGEAKSITTIGIPYNNVMLSINDHFYQSLAQIVPEAVLEGIIGDPNRRSGQHPAKRSSVSTEKRVISTGDADMPFQCGYEGCEKRYPTKQALYAHFRKHINDSQLRCYLEDCTGAVRYRDNQALTRHIHVTHTFERPYPCEDCDMRFRRTHHLKSHRRKLHFLEDKKKTPKRKKK